MLPVKPDFFQCIAQLLQPEFIDGYHCDGCGKTVNAIRYVNIQEIPELAVMSVQRFGMDMYGDFQKDSNPVDFPLCLDLKFVQLFDYEKCQDKDVLVELIKVAMMPWLYFKVEKGKV